MILQNVHETNIVKVISSPKRSRYIQKCLYHTYIWKEKATTRKTTNCIYLGFWMKMCIIHTFRRKFLFGFWMKMCIVHKFRIVFIWVSEWQCVSYTHFEGKSKQREKQPKRLATLWLMSLCMNNFSPPWWTNSVYFMQQLYCEFWQLFKYNNFTVKKLLKLTYSYYSWKVVWSNISKILSILTTF